MYIDEILYALAYIEDGHIVGCSPHPGRTGVLKREKKECIRWCDEA